MIKTKWNIEAAKAYETGQGVELVNDPYPHYIPKMPEKLELIVNEIDVIGGVFETEIGAKGFQNLLNEPTVMVKLHMPDAQQPVMYFVANKRFSDDLAEMLNLN